MRRRISFVLCTVLAVVTLWSAHPVTADTCTPKQFQACDTASFMKLAKDLRAQAGFTDGRFRAQASEDHVIARFSSDAKARAAAVRHGARVLRGVDGRGTVVMQIPKRLGRSALLKGLRGAPGAIYAEPDYRVSSLGQKTPWGIGAVGATAAKSSGFTGAGVTVAIVDTGIDYGHEDLDANVWTNVGEVAGNNLDDDGNGFVDDVYGYDFIGDLFLAVHPDSDPMDEAGHGTHVAGTVAAEDNAIGVVGVAPAAKVMAVKVLDNIGAGWASSIAEGIHYAVDNGADIINMSLGAYWNVAAIGDAVAYAAANGVAVVAAAGNAWFYDFPLFPAGYPSVISVSAAREADRSKTWWSDWGTTDFLAPGDQVLSSTPDDTYDTYSGTSMAAPHVAGALALVKQANPAFNAVQLEHALASTATDVYFPGKDEVSGAGFPDLATATGALPAVQVQLHRGKHVIPADGETGSRITLRILDAAGAGMAGVSGTFATDKGILSDSLFTTDANGLVTTVLTADDELGSASVVATPIGPPGASVRVIVEDDRVQVDEVAVLKAAEEAGGDEGAEAANGGEPEPEPGHGRPSPKIEPGDEVVLTGFLSRHDFGFSSPRVALSFEVVDPNGDAVPALSDTLEAIDIWGFGGQTTASSMPLRVPWDAPQGVYTITATATTIKGGGGNETHALSKTFTVGHADAEVLVVRSGTSFDTESFNFFWPRTEDSAVRRAVESLGRTYSFWDTQWYGQPSEQDLLDHASVIWLGGWDADLPVATLKTYLERGGNLLLSGELYGTYARRNSDPVYRDFMHSVGLLAPQFPDANHQLYPGTVVGTADGPFDALTLDIDAFDLNHVGEPTSFFSEELALSPTSEATEIFSYTDGYYSPAVAGVSVDTGVYRVVNLGFGLESIDAGAEPATLAGTLDTILSGFAGEPEIVDIFPRKVTNAGSSRFLIIGDGFQTTGVTEVRLGSRALTSVNVVDRGLIDVGVPSGFPVGTHSVTVQNPDGSTDTMANAVTVQYPAPRVSSVMPGFVSNDKWRSVTIDGRYFRSGAKVFVQGIHVPSTRVSASRIVASIPRAFAPLGLHDVKVLNTDGKSSTKPDSLRVRHGFTFDMGVGADNAAVTHLQRRLKVYGFFPADHPVTTFFGPVTRGALIKYQKSRGLEQTGFLGYATRKRLNDTR